MDNGAADMAIIEENDMRLTATPMPRRITPEIVRLAKQAGCTPTTLHRLVRRDGLEYTRYAVEGVSCGVFKLNRATLQWDIPLKTDQDAAG